MKRRRIKSQQERQLLTAMIVSKPFLASIASAIDVELFASSVSRRVVKWCLDYFAKYQNAPGENIEKIFFKWSEKRPDDKDVEPIHDLLSKLSEEYDKADQLNVPFLLDQSSDFLATLRLKHLRDNIDDALLQGNAGLGYQAVDKLTSVDLGQGAGIDVLNDRQAWDRSFQANLESLITFKGDAGKFLNKAMTRDALIAIQGPEKRGKTWWCLEFAFRALQSRRRVAMFQVGDLSESQVLMRLGVRMASRPLGKRNCGDIKVPRLVHHYPPANDTDPGLDVEYRKLTKTRTITANACKRASRRFSIANGLSRKHSNFLVSVHANSSINVGGIRGILERWHNEKDFVPDVIVIDYADILAPEDPRKQTRDQINDTWKALRRLSQDYHCLVLVPTQADASSYNKRLLTMSNFSEDKRKLAHVTGMLGLNQTETEKTMQVMRLNWIALRESSFNVNQCLYVGQCLSLGRAMTCATF